MTRRAYQHEALRQYAQTVLRFWAILWERQAGKSTEFGDFALFEMMRNPNRTVVYGSASLLLATEITLKAAIRADQTAREIIEKDAAVLQQFAARAATEVGQGMDFQMADASRDKLVKKLSPADFADLFEQQKLEFRVYHDRTAYSRTKVVAPNIATARGWSGTVLLDEIAFIAGLRELITALLPIISTSPLFKLILSTTPPEFDDTHYSFELLAPPPGMEFKPNAAGNWYESESGLRVHRADAFDTHLAGKKIFDLKTSAEITPEEAFRRAPNKDGHRIAHWLWWTLGGAAACDLQRLKTAQERGLNTCRCVVVDSDRDFLQAMTWLAEHADPHAKIGLGLDKGTTTKEKSNPTVLSVMEEHGPEIVNRLTLVWKTHDPDVNDERIETVLRTLAHRPGGRACALAVDATNEKLDAERQRKKFRAQIPVLLIVASETVDKPGLQKPTNWKQYSGEQYVAKLDDNHLTLPPEAYLRQDHRLVLKDRGKFVCEPDDQGRHGDTFDGNKLGLVALTWRGGPAHAVAVGMGGYQGGTA